MTTIQPVLSNAPLAFLESEQNRLILIRTNESGFEVNQNTHTNDCVQIESDQNKKMSIQVKNSNSQLTPLIVIQGRPCDIKLTLSQNSFCDLLMVDDFSNSKDSANNSQTQYHQEFVLEQNSHLNGVKVFLHPATSESVVYSRTSTLNKDAVFFDRQIFVSNCSVNVKSFVNLVGHNATIDSAGFLLASAGDFYYEPVQNHAVSHTKSQLDFKVVLSKRSKSFFRGLVTMEKNAQHSEAYQENKNLLLSRTARADSEPRLEIIPNDVSCKHGSATSELDPKQLYYLRSRGFDPEQAKQMVVKSFLTAAIKSNSENEENFLHKFVLNTIDNMFDKNSGIFLS